MPARGLAAAAVFFLLLPGSAEAVVEIAWWHAMQGERGRQVEKLASDFNESQSDYRIIPSYKGNYSDTLASAIVALRSRQQPSIVQVVEVATATMMAAKGAIYPVHQLMRDQGEPFDPSAYLPAITGYYRRSRRQPAVVSVQQLDADPLLQQGSVPRRRPQSGQAAHHLERRRHIARKLVDAGMRCGLTTEWPSWIHIENFSAYHNLPIATKSNGFGGYDTELRSTIQPSSATSPCSPNGRRAGSSATAGAPTAPSPSSTTANAGSISARRPRGPTFWRMGASISATACCPIGRTCRAHRRTRSSAAQPCGCSRPAGRRIQGRGAVLRVPVATRPAGLVASMYRLPADHPQGLRSVAGAGLL